MQIVYERCAGLDVHKKSAVACLLVQEPTEPTRKERQTFSTMTADLLRLRDWLLAQGCTHVAMESTGVFWNPIFNVLEGHLEVLVVNAQHIKAVPGRKTDVKDAEWIADLLRHGLRHPPVSCPPNRPGTCVIWCAIARRCYKSGHVASQALAKGTGNSQREVNFGGQQCHGQERTAHGSGYDRGDQRS